MAQETFKTIEGFEDYQISNAGRVISNKHGKNRFLKPQRDALGYYHVRLYPSDDRFGSYDKLKYKYKRPKLEKVHRLVAMSFIPKPDSKDIWEVNHIDGNKENNDVTNLEWVTRGENIKHSWDIGIRDNAAEKAAPKRYKPVLVIAPDGTKLYYQSRKHAAMDFNLSISNMTYLLKMDKPVKKGRAKGYMFKAIQELPPGETFKAILNLEQKLLEYKKISEYYKNYARKRRKKLRK